MILNGELALHGLDKAQSSLNSVPQGMCDGMFQKEALGTEDVQHNVQGTESCMSGRKYV